jgi:two-component sensor histidine kinase/predicted hydrocarbon binding protein
LKTTQHQRIRDLEKEVELLRSENRRLKEKLFTVDSGKTVIVPDAFTPVFNAVEQTVKDYFDDFSIQPENGEIMISGERYVLFKSSSLSYHFLDIIKELYSNRPIDEATRIGNNFLFDIAHVLGKKDGESFHTKMKLTDPIERLITGPFHFAYTGWANVEIFPESTPTPDENYFLKFHHHNSFEAQSWKKAGRKSDIPVCTMSCGYSSGWCEESVGIPLTTVEIECEAMGAEHCTFIMATPEKIAEHLQSGNAQQHDDFDIPVFFEKKYTEDRLRASLEEKERLLHEIHHRVKNNLQVISSLMNLQMDTIPEESLKKEFRSGIMRINTLARIHEMIYSDKDLSSIQVEHYFRHLFLSLVQGYHSEAFPVQVEISMNIAEGFLEPDKAIPLGLILNEITEHAFEKAFAKGGVFRLELTEDATKYYLFVEGNSQEKCDTAAASESGFSLIPILCEQVEASLNVQRSEDGLTYRISFDKAG